MAKDKEKELSWPTRIPLPGVYVRKITTAHIKRERSPLLRPLKQEPSKNDITQKIDKFTPGFGVGKFGCDFCSSAKPNPDIVASKLSRGTSVAVLGLRRIGKSSLLAETRERLRAMGKNVIWVNLDINDTLFKALTVILSQMQQRGNRALIDGIKEWAENSDMIPSGLKTTVDAMISGSVVSPTANFDEKYVEVLFRQTGRLLETQASENKPIIIFDELTTLIKTTIDNSKSDEIRMVVGKLNRFLGLLRYWRTNEVGIRMAVSGSVSVNWLKRQYGIRSDSINDCVRIYVEEMDRNGAKELLNMCIDAAPPPNWNEQLTEELLDLLPAYYPGVVQLAFEAACAEFSSHVNPKDTIRFTILQSLWDHYFEQFDARYQRYGTSERKRINKLFNVLENQESGIVETKEALAVLNGVEFAEDDIDGRGIISNLKWDSFIDIVPGGIRFSSGLVPAWRNNIVGFGN